MIDDFKTTTSISQRIVSFCFSASQRKAKKKNQKLCDLCDFAVNNFFKDPVRVKIMPPLLGMVFNFSGAVVDGSFNTFHKPSISIPPY
jgi:hypothetical protein